MTIAEPCPLSKQLQIRERNLIYLPNSSEHREQCNRPLTDKTRSLL